MTTIEAPSSVFHSVQARFLTPLKQNLIIWYLIHGILDVFSKASKLEVYEITKQGLQARLQIPINGRISSIDVIPPRATEREGEGLFICTEKERYLLLRYDEDKEAVITLEAGDLHDKACRPTERGILTAYDAVAGKMMLIHNVQGLVKVIPLDRRSQELKFREAINLRLAELQVLDLQMLLDEDEAVLAILHQTVRDTFCIATYLFDLKHKELRPGPWKFDDLEYGSHRLIAVPQPRGGVLVIADTSMFYYNHKKKARCAIAMKPTRLTCHCGIDEDGFRFLFADTEGGLYVLILFAQEGLVDSMALEYLGKVAMAIC